MGRGRERMITCAQCGRQVRRDKAVTIEKPVFTNPLDREEVADEQYTRMLTREFSYCPSCGKHFRIYQKKTQQNERSRERERNKQFFQRRPYGAPRPAGQGAPGQTPAATPAQAEQPAETVNKEQVAVAQGEEKQMEADEAFDEENAESDKTA
ncbi:hypothetical protein HYV43_00305 [Candidatus Micrarchaeota archaeon]|nr:hypothetical protein [Candidatus Micrarchaeota archaeon]